jgi:hypothetical protein
MLDPDSEVGWGQGILAISDKIEVFRASGTRIDFAFTWPARRLRGCSHDLRKLPREHAWVPYHVNKDKPYGMTAG